MLLPYFRPSTFRIVNRVQRCRKGRSGKGILYQQVWIPRKGSSSNTSKLRLCIYSPLEPVENAPGLVWMHGGGYGLGIPEQDEKRLRDFIFESGCTVVAPDYALSMEAPYPAALNDCYDALLWLKENASALKVRSDQLMIGGVSAGGGLAAALAIYARDKGEVAIAFQMLLYPMLDDRMTTKSSQRNDAPVWNTKSNETGWKLYLDSMYGADHVPVYAAPARLKDFRNLPPAFAYVGSIDLFCDETKDYMERLRVAGIAVQYKIFEGCYHGFDVLGSRTSPAKEAKTLLIDHFNVAVNTYFAEQPKTTIGA